MLQMLPGAVSLLVLLVPALSSNTTSPPSTPPSSSSSAGEILLILSPVFTVALLALVLYGIRRKTRAKTVVTSVAGTTRTTYAELVDMEEDRGAEGEGEVER